jgi:hypothetical protein
MTETGTNMPVIRGRSAARDAASAPPADPGSRRRLTTDAVVRAFALVLVLLPVLAVLVTRTGRSYFPVEDTASIDLWVRDVFTGHTPLVGAYSRGFNHPGPLLFYALAPLSQLAGGATWATLVGAALVQGVGALLLAWASYRRAGTACMLLFLGALGLTYVGLDRLGQFTHAWNPFAAIPFFFLFLVLAWGAASGRRWSFVGALAAGTFVVQCHVGYAPLVIVALVWAAIVVALDRPPSERHPRWTTVGASSVVVLAVLWLPPVVQELRDRPGNLSALWDYFRDGGAALGLRNGGGLLATEFRIVPPWLGGDEHYAFATGNAAPSSVWWLLIPVALLAAGWAASRRSGRRSDQRFVELAALMGAVSVVALSRLTIDPVPYAFYWRVVVATCIVAASGWAVAHALPVTWAPWPRRAGTAIALGAILWGFGAQVVDVLDHRDHLEPIEAASAQAFAQVESQGLPSRPVLVRALGSTLGGFDQGMIDALDRGGAPVRVDRRYGYHFGDQRTADPSDVAEVWYVSSDGRFGALLPQTPGASLLASTSPLPRADERALTRLQRDAADALRAAGLDDLVDQLDSPLFAFVVQQRAPGGVPGLTDGDVRRISALNARVAASGSCRCSVVAFPAGQDPDLPFTIG